jgi:hypothetical protein
MIVLEAKGYQAGAHNSSWPDTRYVIGVLVKDGSSYSVSDTFTVSSDDAIDMAVQEMPKEVWGVEQVVTWNLTPPEPRYIVGERRDLGWGVWDRFAEEARPVKQRYLSSNWLGKFTSQADADQAAKLLNDRVV